MELETVFRLEVFAIIVQLVLISALFVLNFKYFTRWLKEVQGKIWVLLLLILILGLILRLQYTQTHIKDYRGVDELFHLKSAENIKITFQKNPCYQNDEFRMYDLQPVTSDYGKCELRQPYLLPYSFFVFLFSFLFGSFIKSSFFVSFLFGLLSIALMFFLAYFLFKNEVIALFAALLASFFSLFVEFSNVPNNFIFSVFFIGLSLIMMVLSVKLDTWKSWFLTSLVLVFTAIIRDENILLLAVFIFFIFVQKSNKKKFLLSLLIASLFCVPSVLYVSHPLVTRAISADSPLLGDMGRYSLPALFYNFYFNLKYIAHLLFWILGLIGFLYLFKNKRTLFYFLGSWFMIYFAFYASFNILRNGSPPPVYTLDRFIFCYIPFIIVCAVGMFYIFQKILRTFHKNLKFVMVFLLLGLILFLNINFLIHYPGRLGFKKEYHHLKPENFYENTAALNPQRVVWGIGWEKMNFFITKEKVWDDEWEYLDLISNEEELLQE